MKWTKTWIRPNFSSYDDSLEVNMHASEGKDINFCQLKDLSWGMQVVIVTQMVSSSSESQ